MPSAKDIFASDRSFNKDSMMTDDDQQQSKALLKKISLAIGEKEVIKCCDDEEDFREIKEIMTGGENKKQADSEDVMMIDTSSVKPVGESEQNYFDIKRLLIQERGEEEYYFLFTRKSKQV